MVSCLRPSVALSTSGLGGSKEMRILAIVALWAALGGCATKYQDMGFTGGVAAEQMTADTSR